MTGSAFKRKDAVVRTYFHGRDIYLPVFLYLPCSRNEVGDDEFHGSVSVYFHIDFAGQRPAVSAEGNDPVGYLYAYHFLRINAFHVVHPFAGVVCNLHYVQEAVFGGRCGRRHFHTPCSPVRWHHRGGWAVRRSGSWFRIPRILFLCRPPFLSVHFRLRAIIHGSATFRYHRFWCAGQ